MIYIIILIIYRQGKRKTAEFCDCQPWSTLFTAWRWRYGERWKQNLQRILLESSTRLGLRMTVQSKEKLPQHLEILIAWLKMTWQVMFIVEFVNCKLYAPCIVRMLLVEFVLLVFLLACQVRITMSIGSWGLCCCVCVMSIEHYQSFEHYQYLVWWFKPVPRMASPSEGEN